MRAKQIPKERPPAPVLSLARKLPTLREWAEARPAIDPVLVKRLRGAK